MYVYRILRKDRRGRRGFPPYELPSALENG
jgi:hypothetical protein